MQNLLFVSRYYEELCLGYFIFYLLVLEILMLLSKYTVYQKFRQIVTEIIITGNCV